MNFLDILDLLNTFSTRLSCLSDVLGMARSDYAHLSCSEERDHFFDVLDLIDDELKRVSSELSKLCDNHFS